MNKKTGQEKVFILTVVFITILFVFCMVGCGGSCLGCSWGCESEDDEYLLSGISCVTERACSSSACKSSIGCIDADTEDADVDNMMIITCDKAKSNCNGESNCYNGIFLGKCGGCGDCGDCGDCGFVCGTSEDENIIGCVDGCIGCDSSDGYMKMIFELIYYFLDI